MFSCALGCLCQYKSQKCWSVIGFLCHWVECTFFWLKIVVTKCNFSSMITGEPCIEASKCGTTATYTAKTSEKTGCVTEPMLAELSIMVHTSKHLLTLLSFYKVSFSFTHTHSCSTSYHIYALYVCSFFLCSSTYEYYGGNVGFSVVLKDTLTRGEPGGLTADLPVAGQRLYSLYHGPAHCKKQMMPKVWKSNSWRIMLLLIRFISNMSVTKLGIKRAPYRGRVSEEAIGRNWNCIWAELHACTPQSNHSF